MKSSIKTKIMWLGSIFALALVFIDCKPKDKKDDEQVNKTEIEQSPNTKEELTEMANEYAAYNPTANVIPDDGLYLFDIAFAEHEGSIMKEKVAVLVKGNFIKVTYVGENGELGSLEKGEVLDSGLIVKHKSGSWIIAQSKHQNQMDEVGGCTDGPTIIDFLNKQFWMC